MFRLTAVAVCVLLTLSATGQQRKYNVVLNDGSRISGTIVGDSAGYVDIKVTTPQIIRIGKSQVSSLETQAYPVKKNLKTEGYYIRFSTGILTGKNESGKQSSFSFHLANGYRFKNGVGIGVGSGIEELGVVIIPLYADLNYTPLNSRISPYAWLKSGYGFAASEETVNYDYYSSPGSISEGGFLFNAGAGISMFTWKRTAVNIGIGYRYQKVTISRDQYWWYGGTAVRETVTHFNRLELHLGFIFR
jgi:hypothetical protein